MHDGVDSLLCMDGWETSYHIAAFLYDAATAPVRGNFFFDLGSGLADCLRRPRVDTGYVVDVVVVGGAGETGGAWRRAPRPDRIRMGE